MRDGGPNSSTVSADGLFSGYKIAGNLARKKALDSAAYQY
jgi:hypothetical protein